MSESIEVALDVRCDLPGELQIDERLVETVLTAAGRLLAVSGEVSVSLVSDDEIHDLNRTYRNVDRPTDVLSFALREGEEDDLCWPDDGKPPEEAILEQLGDIVVSLPTALRQAEEYGHTPQREVGFLLVHGFLHLLGYDHEEAAAEAEMTRLQEQVLEEVGLRRDSSPESDRR